MADNSNIGYAFPLEKLGSDIARNNYNYQSILNGLIEWNNTNDDTVLIRLTKDTDPWYEDYEIPSKKNILSVGSYNCDVKGEIASGSFASTYVSSTLYGGSKTYPNTTFNAASGVNTSTNEITLADGTILDNGDRVYFVADPGATLPGGIDSITAYYVFTHPSTNVITLTTTSDVNSLSATTVPISSIGSGTITVYKYAEPLDISTTDPADTAIIRISATSTGTVEWDVYFAPVIENWQTSGNYKAGNLVIYNNVYYKVLFDVTNASVIPSTDTAHYDVFIKTWTSGMSYLIGDIVLAPNGYLYKKIDNQYPSTAPNSNSNDFELYAVKWVYGTTYNAGSYIYDSGLLYMATSLITNSTTSPINGGDSDKWQNIMFLKVPTSNTFTNNVVFVWNVDMNVSEFRLRNISEIPSTSSTAINVRITGKSKEPNSIYQRSVETFDTSNYSYWPYDKNSIWSNTTTYGPTDDSIPVTKRQDYSASMIFDHTRPDIAKTTNFINYDGPDLDQGLCIYLPVQIDVGDDGIAYPEDGFTYEFFFRIWPNSSLNGENTRDHIVNKAQIYVYSALDLDTISEDLCEVPIAKFSMARATNFYMFGENVTIPDKPVCYRATFIYNAADEKWCTLDYYQLPDHIFVGPVGFIDPQSPANLDINEDVIGNINPNASNIGYETAAFPLFQDPFSNPDLTPYRVSGDSLNAFKNRII
jgi:hypothetical protein